MRAILVLSWWRHSPRAARFDTVQASSGVPWPVPSRAAGGSLPTTGARRAVLLGAVSMAAGQFVLVMHSLPSFYGGLSMIAVGTGLLKPNISAMVGRLYGPDDPRRDSGFSLFYMGINIGALMAPLVCGWLAESPAFKAWLAGMGMDPARSWHYGFGAAGIGMLVGILVYVMQAGRLPQTDSAAAQKAKATAARRESSQPTNGSGSAPSSSSSRSPSCSGRRTSRRARA
jgi:MFS family permease